MCGIIGCTARENVAQVLVSGLTRLEYRGYDSAGIALGGDGGVKTLRRMGKLAELSRALEAEPVEGLYGIGHTRWATHGRPSETNAHPHIGAEGKVAVVHNGIIENYSDIREELIRDGYKLRSDTDSEVIAFLIEREHEKCSLLEAVRRVLPRLEGAFAVAAISSEQPDTVVASRRHSPLIVGVSEGAHYLASDIPALLEFTRDVVDLEEDDVVEMHADSLQVFDKEGRQVERPVRRVHWDLVTVQKGGYKHFMEKEIEEQPAVLAATLDGRIAPDDSAVILDELSFGAEEAKAVKKITIVACGTSWHAAHVGKFYLEGLAKIPVEVDYASEYRYRDPIVGKDELIIAVSQSGETADTLAAARYGQDAGAKLLAICNVEGSTLARESDFHVMTAAGPEIGVASTKAFTTQLTVFYLIALHLAHLRGRLATEALKPKIQALRTLRFHAEQVLAERDVLAQMAPRFADYSDFLFLGRGINYPIALEGALKLKEISYIHAEGYPAGEMKHGPIALVDNRLPVVVVAPKSRVYDKVISNIEAVKARDGHVIAIGTRGDEALRSRVDEMIEIPDVSEELSPLLTVLPLQLLAYHIARWRGCDVDQPRNLAKSVTVE